MSGHIAMPDTDATQPSEEKGWYEQATIYCEATCGPDDVYYEGSEDEDYGSPTKRKQRYEAAGHRFLADGAPFLLSATLRGPFDEKSGWNNPWRSKTYLSQRYSTTLKSQSIAIPQGINSNRSSPRRKPRPAEILGESECHLPSPESLKQVPVLEHPYLQEEELANVKKWRSNIVPQSSMQDELWIDGPSKESRKRRAAESSWLRRVKPKRRQAELMEENSLTTSTISRNRTTGCDLHNIEEDAGIFQRKRNLRDDRVDVDDSDGYTSTGHSLQTKSPLSEGEVDMNEAAAATLSSPISQRHLQTSHIINSTQRARITVSSTTFKLTNNVHHEDSSSSLSSLPVAISSPSDLDCLHIEDVTPTELTQRPDFSALKINPYNHSVNPSEDSSDQYSKVLDLLDSDSASSPSDQDSTPCFANNRTPPRRLTQKSETSCMLSVIPPSSGGTGSIYSGARFVPLKFSDSEDESNPTSPRAELRATKQETASWSSNDVEHVEHVEHTPENAETSHAKSSDQLAISEASPNIECVNCDKHSSSHESNRLKHDSSSGRGGPSSFSLRNIFQHCVSPLRRLSQIGSHPSSDFAEVSAEHTVGQLPEGSVEPRWATCGADYPVLRKPSHVRAETTLHQEPEEVKKAVTPDISPFRIGRQPIEPGASKKPKHTETAVPTEAQSPWIPGADDYVTGGLLYSAMPDSLNNIANILPSSRPNLSQPPSDENIECSRSQALRSYTPEPQFAVSTFASFMTPSPERLRRMDRPAWRGSQSRLSDSQHVLASAMKNPWGGSTSVKRVSWASLPHEESSGQNMESTGSSNFPLLSSTYNSWRPTSPPPATQLSELPVLENVKFGGHFAAIANRKHSTLQHPLPSASQKPLFSHEPQAMVETFLTADNVNANRPGGVPKIHKEEEGQGESGGSNPEKEDMQDPLDIVEDMFNNMSDILQAWDVDAELDEARKAEALRGSGFLGM